MKKKKVKMIFEVVVDFDIMIDDETFKKEYNNDIVKLAKYLYKEDSFWWDSEMKLVDAKIC